MTRPLADDRVPRAWAPWLGAAKAVGAVGLLTGLFVPAIGLVLLLPRGGGHRLPVTVLRARWFSHVPFPLLYAAPAAASHPRSPAPTGVAAFLHRDRPERS
ncbi:hypothetical protein QA802_35125 [Streptomyces sp. B21-105]|uniref:hypothetical protein n=1 Tax=Streptomyces sp. B21-105 TaxID=3039417 RepID=UPI002FF04424